MPTDTANTPAAAPAEEISGKVTHLYKQSATWCAGKMSVRHRDTSFTVKGYVKVGEPVTLRGKWTTHAKYGRQFVATEVVYSTPADPAGVKAWLEWYAPDVGPVKAQQMVDEYGVGLLEMCGTDPAQVAAFARIPIESVKRIANEWSAFAVKCGVVSELAAAGLTQHQAEQVYARFKGSALTILRDDPYLLLREIEGFGWKVVDALAKKLGVAANHPGRLRAAVVQAVVEASDDGSTAVEQPAAVGRACDLAGQPDADLSDRIQDAADKGQLKVVCRRGNLPPYLALPAAHRHESLIWTVLQTSRKPNPHVRGDAAEFADPYRGVAVGGKVVGLDDTQHAAVVAAAANRIVFVTGGAGSGKSTVCKAIYQMFRDAHTSVRLAAPTGKAARRLTDIIGKEATTIHRLLEYRPDGGFTYDDRYQLPSGALIVDECFPWKQRILTEDGWEYIGKIVEQRLQVRVYSRNPATAELELKPVVGWMKKPAPATLLRIDATRSDSKRDARVIRCTHSHKIMTPMGYVRADELKVGDRVLARGSQLTAVQRSVLIGSIFGDASVSRGSARKSPQIVFCHGVKQIDYLEFKEAVFAGLTTRAKVGVSGYTGRSDIHRSAMRMVDEAYELAGHMTPDGQHPSGRQRWCPSPELLEMVDEQALAVWFLDNGSVSHTERDVSYASLHTERFTEEVNRQIATYLQSRFGLTAQVRQSRGFSYLGFNKEDTAKLFDIVRPYTPACMAWKVPGGNYSPQPQIAGQTCEAVIRSINEEPHTDYASVYDIEVEDHHNYVAGNIIVSNCSMVDSELMFHLLRACGSNTSLVFIGDPNQLPPVGPGSVLRDVIDHDLAPVVRLGHCHRQAGPLKENCHAILDGRVEPSVVEEAEGKASPWMVHRNLTTPEQVVKGVTVLFEKYLPQWGYDPVEQTQFLTARHAGPLGTTHLNRVVQRLRQKQLGVELPEIDPDSDEKPVLMVGDKVIQTRNNYQIDVMNGTQGVVVATAPQLVIRYDAREVQYPGEFKSEVQLAYVITPHKAQGSEWDCVVGVVHKSHGFMQHRNWTYTLGTRARKTTVLIGDDDGIRRAAERVDNTRRVTLLGVWATNPEAAP